MLTTGSVIFPSTRRAAELERSNEELGKFAYVASHDLQEPLRTISSYTELLVEEYGDRLDGEADEYVEFIVDGANRMQQLIKDLLAFSRVGTRGKKFSAVDCEAIVNGVLHSLTLAVQESQAQITCDSLPVVNADPSQMQQLFQNLIGQCTKGSEAKKFQIFTFRPGYLKARQPRPVKYPTLGKIRLNKPGNGKSAFEIMVSA